MAKISLSELWDRPSTVDRAKLDATTEEDIQRHREEDGYGDFEFSDAAVSIPVPEPKGPPILSSAAVM